MHVIQVADAIILMLFVICYAYQSAFIPIAMHRKPKLNYVSKLHRYAVLIAARNEQSVIGQLVDSIKAQTYPAELIHIFVVADNCTDNTAAVAAAHGATVYCRHNRALVGKGYALNYMLKHIDKDFGLASFDAFMVFDADNLLDENYITQMNETFCQGHQIITSYRNTKNYGDNWISAGYGLVFLRESQYLNRARFKLGSSCAVSGTGYMFSYDILKECGGWNFFLLTEDIQFTMHNIVAGHKIAYCENAVFYDEQPTSFAVSFRQRMRWSKGVLQVFRRYGLSMTKDMLKGDFSCYDMLMNNLPAYLLTIAGTVLNIATIFIDISAGYDMTEVIWPLLKGFLYGYITMWLAGAITTGTEWNRIVATRWRKILYVFTFPLFMMTYVPIAMAALVVKVNWTPITHDKTMTMAQVHRQQASLLSVSQLQVPSK